MAASSGRQKPPFKQGAKEQKNAKPKPGDRGRERQESSDKPKMAKRAGRK